MAFEGNVSMAIRWIVKIDRIHDPLRMNYNHFGDPLTYHLVKKKCFTLSNFGL